ncbi:hypothetical protein GJ744_005227 [Endocarpon pusillum]|uniref:Uncharacterized protein n=1 Tax=Endocarpon pusillum TaxID=364733 RepID=A0A8H7DX84_9EURO|nr:hypothetical protein GJ744_005227 [Endocarpon pusillum]
MQRFLRTNWRADWVMSSCILHRLNLVLHKSIAEYPLPCWISYLLSLAPSLTGAVGLSRNATATKEKLTSILTSDTYCQQEMQHVAL